MLVELSWVIVQRFGFNWSLLFYTATFILGQQPCAELAVQEDKKKNNYFWKSGVVVPFGPKWSDVVISQTRMLHVWKSASPQIRILPEAAGAWFIHRPLWPVRGLYRPAKYPFTSRSVALCVALQYNVQRWSLTAEFDFPLSQNRRVPRTERFPNLPTIFLLKVLHRWTTTSECVISNIF